MKMHKIVKLWAVPRSTSTAFEWMMRQRGDMTCFHEPYGEAWYQGEAPLWPRLTADSLRTPGLTFDSVTRALHDAAAERPVFSKDFPHYIETLWDDAFLAPFTHSFLIRDPAKTVASIVKHWPDVDPKELGFHEQRALFERLAARDGTAPPVIDSDDLLENPHGTVSAWCAAVGIPFVESALSWEPGARDEVSWWDGGSFHDNLRNSDGLKPQPRRHADISQASDFAKGLYEDVLPAYQALYAHRLRTVPA